MRVCEDICGIFNIFATLLSLFAGFRFYLRAGMGGTGEIERTSGRKEAAAGR